MANYSWPKITKDTSLEEIKRIHKDIWNYTIEHGKKPDTPYMCGCAACEYDELCKGACCSCPIEWPDTYCLLGGLYTKWKNATGEEKTELAHQIRDLPWKFETENYEKE